MAAGAPVAVTELRLSEYRGYANARLDVDAAPVVLTGPNGAGKTNLLEAISYLSPGRGLRGARLGDLWTPRRQRCVGRCRDGRDTLGPGQGWHRCRSLR